MEKPALPLLELNAEHLGLSLLNGEQLFLKHPNDLGTCVPLSH